ncbi:hypothetical protein [Halalkalibacter sp. APA_J-10(15)]|nr:hypothetical protein [Halalkalibacter sp. APA_J-10(15)]MCK0470946.1 hypothetical protein [Halalkalibacter sp. APA_J-10(15)]
MIFVQGLISLIFMCSTILIFASVCIKENKITETPTETKQYDYLFHSFHS